MIVGKRIQYLLQSAFFCGIVRSTILAALVVGTIPAQPSTFSGIERIVAIGDVHGDYDALVEVLRFSGVVDGKNKWTGGKTHLVQVGDIPDRGPDTRKAIELLMKLEKDARKAGGAVHVLIGNHDAMNMYGDLRYVTPPEFAAFKSGNSSELRDAYYQQMLEQEKPADPAAFKKKFEMETPLGWVEHRQAWSAKGELGKWTLSHNAIVKIDDTLFVHAGISPRIAAMSLEDINRTVRAELSDFSKLKGGIVMAEDGPLWYRGLVNDPEDKAMPLMDTFLKNYGAARLVVGHTPTKQPIATKLGVKLIDIDTGLSRAFSGPKDCLVIEGGKLYTMPDGKKTPLH